MGIPPIHPDLELPLSSPHVNVRVIRVPGKGRGVVASRRIKKGEVFERAHVIVVAREQVPHVQRTILDNYVYEWSDGGYGVALGAGSLFNHSYSPNANYLKHFDEAFVDYVALADIEAGDEITINYNGDPADRSPMSFDVVGS